MSKLPEKVDAEVFMRLVKFREAINSFFYGLEGFTSKKVVEISSVINNENVDFHLRYPTGREVIIFMDEDKIRVSMYAGNYFKPDYLHEKAEPLKAVFLEDEIETTKTEGKIPRLAECLFWGLRPVEYEGMIPEDYTAVPPNDSSIVTLVSIDEYVPVKRKPKNEDVVTHPFRLYEGKVKSKSFRKLPGQNTYKVDITFTTGKKATVFDINYQTLEALTPGTTAIVSKLGNLVVFPTF